MEKIESLPRFVTSWLRDSALWEQMMGQEDIQNHQKYANFYNSIFTLFSV